MIDYTKEELICLFKTECEDIDKVDGVTKEAIHTIQHAFKLFESRICGECSSYRPHNFVDKGEVGFCLLKVKIPGGITADFGCRKWSKK